MKSNEEFTVSQISALVKKNIEQNFSYVKVRGEISGLKKAPSGHVYLSLKDQNAVLAAVCWRGTFDNLKVKPEEGMEVVCSGALTTYPGQSKYQITIESFEHSGIGALMAMLEKRKKALAAEGLFDQAHKKKIPLLPKLIGVVTSPGGSVIRDIIHRVEDRCPTNLLIWPVLVQGAEASAQIAAAIRGFSQLKMRPEVIIVARGGGSIEDLWCFNEEDVVRAVFECPIPIIAAVGHETDFTLIDFVADIRAPTPTAAAELAVPVIADLRITLKMLANNLYRAMQKIIEERITIVNLLGKSMPTPLAYLATQEQKLDEMWFSLARNVINITHKTQERFLRVTVSFKSPANMIDKFAVSLDSYSQVLRTNIAAYHHNKERDLSLLGQLLDSFSFENTLKRGFAIIRSKESGEIIKSAVKLSADECVEIELQDGIKQAVIV